MPLKNKTNSKRKKSGINDKMSEFIRIQIFALLIYVLCFFTFSLISLAVDLRKDYVYYISLCLFCLSSFAVGFIAGVKSRQKGLITGILSALPMNLLFMLISLILNGFQADMRALLSAALMIAVSAIGGIVSVNIKVKK